MASFVSLYARAFADVMTGRRLDTGEVLTEVQSIVEMLVANPALKAAWENPSVDGRQKIALLDAIAARMDLSPEVRNFIAILIDHRRIGSVGEIARQLQREINERLGLADAEIVTARELDPSEKKLLEAKVAAAIGKVVRAVYRQDQTLLGGALVKVGSTIYDGSVRGQLRRLREQLTAS